MALNLPELFVERLGSIVPADALGDVLRSFSATRPTAFRVNTLRATVECVREELTSQGLTLSPVPWLAEAFVVAHEQREMLTHAAAAGDGRIYIQNLSSMLASLVLAPQPGETILDLAAAPGGKTLHLAAMMHNEGVLSAVEAVRGRMYRLQANVKLAGATMVKTYLTDGRSVGRKTPERFDRVLLDAPCSSEARFRAGDAKSWATWSPRKIRETARKQKGLLKSAIRALRVGGVLLYCTCSFAPEENERIVHDALRRFGQSIDVAAIELPIANHQPGLTEWDGKPLDERLAGCRRILPTGEMDGLFLCKMVKTRSTQRT